jgi:hypothetical protein
VPGVRSAGEHWIATRSVLRRLQWTLLAVAALAIAAYCGIVAWRFQDARALWFVVLFGWPPLTIGILAFFQRLMLGGPTKRIPIVLIRDLKWSDRASFPYRLRDAVLAALNRGHDIDPMAPSPGYLTRLLVKAISFLPPLVAMLVPIAGMAWLTGYRPSAGSVWARAWTFETLAALTVFMLYVACCAAHELVRTWRQIVAAVTSRR